MRLTLQTLLVRLAMGVLGLASRLAPQRLEREETDDFLAAAAVMALDEARQQATDGAGQAPSSVAGPADQAAPAAGAAPAGYARLEPRAQLSPLFGNALLLVDEDGRRFVPILVGPTEALAFKTRLDRQPHTRPLTHDLFDALLERIGASVVSVLIDELRNSVFYARLLVDLDDGRRLEFDARPSDAIVLAMGHDAPIYGADAVLQQAAKPLECVEPAVDDEDDDGGEPG